MQILNVGALLICARIHEFTLNNYTAFLVMNDAGGFVFRISDEALVRRFLILGTTGGTYYVTEKELTMRAVSALCDIIERGNI